MKTTYIQVPGRGLMNQTAYELRMDYIETLVAGMRKDIKSETILLAQIQNNIERIHKRHLEFEQRIKSHHKVKQTRVTGVIFALDLDIKMDRYGNLRDQLYAFFMENMPTFSH